MDYIYEIVLSEAGTFKNGAFKDRIAVDKNIHISRVFKILIGSSLTTPSEKEVFRHALEWIDYLQAQFGGLVRLSRFHSMLYSGVFVEKVFRVFSDDRQSHQKAKDNGNSQKKPQRSWGLQHVGDGINDRLVVADDWSIIRIPEGSDELKNDDTLPYRAKMTKEGGELHSAFGKVKDLSSDDGILSKPRQHPPFFKLDVVRLIWNRAA